MPTNVQPKARWSTRPLTEKPRTLYIYYVTGRGQFPLDMLRYDCAWPASSVDVSKIEDYERKPRSVQLHSYQEPTIARWSSFVWSVGNEKLET
jgi:hypothetical protein